MALRSHDQFPGLSLVNPHPPGPRPHKKNIIKICLKKKRKKEKKKREKNWTSPPTKNVTPPKKLLEPQKKKEEKKKKKMGVIRLTAKPSVENESGLLNNIACVLSHYLITQNNQTSSSFLVHGPVHSDQCLGVCVMFTWEIRLYCWVTQCTSSIAHKSSF